jgi:iron complex transport system ATP-binding protein
VRLAVRDLSVRYGARVALDSVRFEARGGEVVALIGPNGSGKSTLLRVIAGLQRHHGSLALDGAAREAVGFLPQDNGARAALTVLETVLLGRRRALGWRVPETELGRAAEALRQLGIAALVGSSNSSTG